MSTMKLLLSMAVMIVFVTSSAAYGVDGVYVGVGAGASKVADWCDGIVGTCDDVGTGWKVFGGTQFNPYVGFEAAYVNLGTVTGTDTSVGIPIDVDAEVSGLNFAVVGIAPVADRFAFFGKIGFYLSTLDLHASGGASGSDSASGTGLALGLGGSVSVTERVFVRLEWERFADIGDDDLGKDDVDLLSVGIGTAF
jgi:OOP family OmpA-OmpF porin